MGAEGIHTHTYRERERQTESLSLSLSLSLCLRVSVISADRPLVVLGSKPNKRKLSDSV